MSNIAAAGAMAFGVLACGDTLDVFGSGGTEGGTTAMSSGAEATSSSSGSATDSGGSAEASTTTAATSGSETSSATSGSTTAGPGELCERLDLLLVMDNTPDNEAVRDLLLSNAAALAVLLTDPDRPWSDDFHVGVVPTNTTGTSTDCRVVGGLSAHPDAALPQPCELASGGNYATQADVDLVAAIQCLGQVQITDPNPEPRRVALAAARGLGIPPAADAEGVDVVDGCNAGFTRELSLKVVIVVSSSDDPGGGVGSPDDPSAWHGWFDAVRNPQFGSDLVLIGLVPDPAMPSPQCPAAPNLLAWIDGEPSSGTSDWCAFEQSGGVALALAVTQQLSSICGA